MSSPKLSLTVITRESLLLAMKECRELGRDAFLAKYGFRKATGYVLTYRNATYDPKALVGAAAQHTEAGRPYTAKEFSGGKARLGPLFKRCGLTHSEVGS
jgi:5-methylcytosine-specific restriction protein A